MAWRRYARWVLARYVLRVKKFCFDDDNDDYDCYDDYGNNCYVYNLLRLRLLLTTTYYDLIRPTMTYDYYLRHSTTYYGLLLLPTYLPTYDQVLPTTTYHD